MCLKHNLSKYDNFKRSAYPGTFGIPIILQNRFKDPFSHLFITLGGISVLFERVLNEKFHENLNYNPLFPYTLEE